MLKIHLILIWVNVTVSKSESVKITPRFSLLLLTLFVAVGCVLVGGSGTRTLLTQSRFINLQAVSATVEE